MLSHQPLHYSMRLYNEGGDAQYAKYLVDVLNAAGQRGLNIIFLYGHNYSSVDDYIGGSTNFIGKGETIWIANPEGYSKESSSRILNFTYMNAGYVSSTTTTGPDQSSNMSVFEITGDDVVIRRYDATGEHALQAAAGVMSSTDIANGYSTDRDPCASSKKVYGGDLDVTVSSIVSTGDFHMGGFATARVTNPEAGCVYNWTFLLAVFLSPEPLVSAIRHVCRSGRSFVCSKLL